MVKELNFCHNKINRSWHPVNLFHVDLSFKVYRNKKFSQYCGEKTKIEKSKESVEKDINSILQLLGKIVNNKSQNIKRGEQEHESIKEFIVKIRNEIDKHLTHLEKKICNEADTILNEEKSKATDLIAEIEEKQKNLKKMQDQLHTVIPHASNSNHF
ncbi:unnamed protein product [Mytilus edulis]|uniref:Uncharacterized protein n=1 Tax=Mytilus edulis TaxID=6550 RepID=A0A8S3U1K8_MYTED|nr:unnamed protein product [Mytilus edulis]